MGLQSFEHGLERMVEGVFSRSSRSAIRPVELGRRLLREMDDHRSVDVRGRRIVPNAFTFHLSPKDLASFADIDFPIPVPRPRPYLSAREGFMYIVMFSTLYLSAYNVGSIIFELIDRAFPDPARPEYAEWSIAAIRWSVSSLIVAFPVFSYVSWLIARGGRIDPTKRSSRIRKQLTYLTLLLGACVLLGDLTALVYSLLGGELTVRFVLKAATIGVITGAIFGYYLYDLRNEEAEDRP